MERKEVEKLIEILQEERENVLKKTANGLKAGDIWKSKSGEYVWIIKIFERDGYQVRYYLFDTKVTYPEVCLIPRNMFVEVYAYEFIKNQPWPEL